MKAAIYARVSTIEQATEGYSIQVQKEKLESYAKAMGYDVVGVYSDEGFSGKTLTRPDMESMLKDVKARKIDIVLIYKLDRLSRRVIDVLQLVEMFDEFNVTLFSLNENLDLSSPFGRAALKMSATFSELERETIVERMQMGKTARAKSGKYSCPGKVPFGYRLSQTKDDYLEADKIESDIIRKLFDLYINEGYTFRKLYLYAKNAYPDVKFFSNEMSCKPLLHRPMYSGYFMFKDELIKGTNFDSIISYETYLMAQNKIEENTTKKTRDNSPYLLTGLLVCGKCGHNYAGKLYDRYNKKADGSHTKHYVSRSYGCIMRVKIPKSQRSFDCDNIIISANELDENIVNKVSSIQFTKAQAKSFMPGLIDNLMTEISKLQERKDKLLDLYLDNSIDKDNYTLRMVEIEAKISENKMLISSEKDKIISTPTDSVDAINEKLRKFKYLEKKEQVTILRSIIKNIVISNENMLINWKFDI